MHREQLIVDVPAHQVEHRVCGLLFHEEAIFWCASSRPVPSTDTSCPRAAPMARVCCRGVMRSGPVSAYVRPPVVTGLGQRGPGHRRDVGGKPDARIVHLDRRRPPQGVRGGLCRTQDRPTRPAVLEQPLDGQVLVGGGQVRLGSHRYGGHEHHMLHTRRRPIRPPDLAQRTLQRPGYGAGPVQRPYRLPCDPAQRGPVPAEHGGIMDGSALTRQSFGTGLVPCRTWIEQVRIHGL